MLVEAFGGGRRASNAKGAPPSGPSAVASSTSAPMAAAPSLDLAIGSTTPRRRRSATLSTRGSRASLSWRAAVAPSSVSRRHSVASQALSSIAKTYGGGSPVASSGSERCASCARPDSDPRRNHHPTHPDLTPTQVYSSATRRVRAARRRQAGGKRSVEVSSKCSVNVLSDDERAREVELG